MGSAVADEMQPAAEALGYQGILPYLTADFHFCGPTGLAVSATAVCGWGTWFTSGTLSGTASFDETAETTIRSYNAGARLGRRWVCSRNNIAAPCIGLNSFVLDQTVEGVTRLNDAFQNGGSLEVRSRAVVRNIAPRAVALEGIL